MKLKFSSKSEAKSAAKKLACSGAEQKTHDNLTIYICPTCNHWHMGHRKGWSPNIIRKKP